VDLSPTLREWFGLPATPKSEGRSLFGREGRDRALMAVSVEPTLLFGVEPSLGVRQGALLYLLGRREELFDLSADPLQTRDLAGRPESRGDLDRLRALCERTWRPGWLYVALPPSLAPSPEELKSLQSLGYISGAAPAKNRVQRADVRDVMKDRSEWDRGREEAYRTGKSEGLLALYARLVAKYPTSLSLRNWYGPLLARTGHTQEAIRQLEEAVRLYPQDSAALSNLGALYMVAGRLKAAENFLKSALERDPNNRMAHKQLGILYADHLDIPEKAVVHYRRYLEMGGDSDAPKIEAYIRNSGKALSQRPRRDG
jgi:tetratricopeptide (TPR) repeat protein